MFPWYIVVPSLQIIFFFKPSCDFWPTVSPLIIRSVKSSHEITLIKQFFSVSIVFCGTGGILCIYPGDQHLSFFCSSPQHESQVIFHSGHFLLLRHPSLIGSSRCRKFTSKVTNAGKTMKSETFGRQLCYIQVTWRCFCHRVMTFTYILFSVSQQATNVSFWGFF